MIPEREDMIALALGLEQSTEEFGWNQKPMLGMVADAGDKYVTRPTLRQPFDLAAKGNGDVSEALIYMADRMMKSTDVGHRIRRERGKQDVADALAGLWFIAEAWIFDAEKVPDGGRVADLPAADRTEIRSCFLVDCGGRRYHVSRSRGDQPEILVGDPGDPSPIEVQRVILEALRRMLLAIGTNMSDGMIDMEALSKVGAVDG